MCLADLRLLSGLGARPCRAGVSNAEPGGGRESGAAQRRRLDTFAHSGPDSLIFTGPAGTPLRGANFRQRTWLPALRMAGLPAIHFTIYGTRGTR